jgi:hypothetical protein
MYVEQKTYVTCFVSRLQWAMSWNRFPSARDYWAKGKGDDAEAATWNGKEGGSNASAETGEVEEASSGQVGMPSLPLRMRQVTDSKGGRAREPLP